MELQQELLQRIEGAEAVLRAALAEGQHMWLLASDAQKTRLAELIGKSAPPGPAACTCCATGADDLLCG